MAEYRDLYPDIKAAGVQLAAISVDDPSRSAPMKADLDLPFPILSDSSRDLITRWGLLNRKEMGGIAYPAVFAIDRELTVRFRSLDQTARRADASEVAAAITAATQGRPIQTELPRRFILPGLMFLRAILNTITRGSRTPWSEHKEP